LKIQGVRKVQDYLLKEVQKVYRLQGVEINDKHIEMIVRQMLRKMHIEDPGDSEFLPDTTVGIVEFEETNEKLIAEGKKPAVGKEELKGITKASLTTESFLSAASFQETTRVLTEASINGKIDKLQGLKENVIIGRTIPTGTGMKKYQSTLISTDIDDIIDDDDDSFELNPENISYEAKEYKVQNTDDEE
jgi:DNA-directed RNA polymerase subunit beta'